MRFTRAFEVAAPLDKVALFHSESASMARITPPPIVVKMIDAPLRLGDGDEMSFTLWLGPVPMRWKARIENVGPTGFVDRQLEGPFSQWVHRHIFVPTGKHSTLVVDVIDGALAPDPIGKMIGIGMWLGLPLLFSYRAWKTRRILN